MGARFGTEIGITGLSENMVGMTGLRKAIAEPSESLHLTRPNSYTLKG